MFLFVSGHSSAVWKCSVDKVIERLGFPVSAFISSQDRVWSHLGHVLRSQVRTLQETEARLPGGGHRDERVGGAGGHGRQQAGDQPRQQEIQHHQLSYTALLWWRRVAVSLSRRKQQGGEDDSNNRVVWWISKVGENGVKWKKVVVLELSIQKTLILVMVKMVSFSSSFLAQFPAYFTWSK